MNFKNLTIKDIRNILTETDLEDFYHHYFEFLKEEDKKIKGFLFLNEELAYKTIKELKNKDRNLPLWGIPIAIKDNILVEGIKCTAGSKILENYTAVYDATVIKKLKQSGAIIVGKTNLDEFAMGSSTENSAFFQTLNPFDQTRVPGGSSGGSAAVVGAGLVPIALGSDTGGSIRQPAGFCGIYGLKPTYSAISRYGLIAMASSLDQIGPLAKDLDDLILVFRITRGKDELDSTSQNYVEKIKEIRKIGVPEEVFSLGLEKEVKDVFENFLEKIKEKFEIKKISLPSLPYALPTYYLIMTAEVSSNLARYDGIRYGLSYETDHLLEKYLNSRELGFGQEVKRRILLGTFVLSHGYYEAYYLKALKTRKFIYEDFQKAFKEVDLILMPTSPTLPFKLGEKTTDPLSMYLSDIFTVPINLAYLPALAFNIGWVNNLPVGAQIIGNLFEEESLFKFLKEIEIAKLTRT
ncbi:MAG: glutamyl-tRNA(Gln) amidotransferase subunit A [Candidatus Parcubacteria bacterium]|nr:MAG: glutamyl-tRNA(Gln) amidotransferase subunit A [Candidatus Parcubacteria bacterium]